MKKVWLVLSLIPIPFIFHFYEYSQKIKGEEPTFLLIGFILSMLITGVLSRDIKFIHFISLNLITLVISLALAAVYITDDPAWFAPFGRNFAVVFIGVVYLIGQIIVRSIAKMAILLIR